MKNGTHEIRKAAILVASLDAASADSLLAQMPAEQAERVRQLIVEIGPLDADEQAAVIKEFFRISPLMSDKYVPGIQLDGPLARHMLRPDPYGADGVVYEPSPSREHRLPFRFLHDADGPTLAPVLEREHPQTIAVVLSHLPPDRAVQVLASLPAALQPEVARRLVDLDATDPEILREVERGLETWFSEQVRGQERRRAGIAALSSMLEAADKQTQRSILANLDQHDRQLARRILAARPRAAVARELTFADLVTLDDEHLVRVIQSADAEVTILALAGASSRFVDRVLAQLPPEAAKMLRYGLAHLGPTRLSDVEDAMHQLARVATELERGGQVQARHNQFSLAV